MAFLPENNKTLVHSGINDNSVNDFTERTAGRILMVSDIQITGAGTVTTNVFQVTGSIEILKTWAIIKSVTTLTNMTDVYADAWDGTNSVQLTNGNPGGAVLSGAPVGTLFTKDKDASNAYTVSLADQVRVLESINNRNIQLPFVVTQKSATDTFIRFIYTTTDNPVDLTMDIFFEWTPLDGGDLTVVS